MYYPNVQASWHTPLVDRTMKGCLRLHSTTIKQKQALTVSDLSKGVLNLTNSREHNYFLFQALLLTGFFALVCLGELTFPNDISLQNWKKSQNTPPSSFPPISMNFTSLQSGPFFQRKSHFHKKTTIL